MTTSVRSISAAEFVAIMRQSFLLFFKRCWTWPLIMVLSFAPAFVGAALPADPIVKKAFVYFGASLAGIIASAYAVSRYKNNTLLQCVRQHGWALFGVALLGLLLSFMIWKCIELPALSLFATASEMAVYASDPVTDDAAPRLWIDALHTFIVVILSSPLSLATALVMMRGLAALPAALASARCFASNWLIFLVLALVTTFLHAFIQQPTWFFMIHLAIYIFIFTPILTILGVIMADRMTEPARVSA